MTEREDERVPRENEHSKKPRLNLTTSQVAASALAACCASIVASYLGVAGTVIGAAVGSIIATTGAAIWGHLFRKGGDKIKQTLLVNGELVEVEKESAEAQSVPAGRFYGADAAATAKLWTPKDATAETRIVDEDETKLISASDKSDKKPPRLPRLLKYRKPMGITAAVVAVFGISIIVGMLAGAPVRSAGSSTAPSTTTTTTVTETTQGKVGDGSSASSSSSASHGSGATASSSASPSSSATGSSSASSAASPSASTSTGGAATATATPQAQGATSTGSP